MSTELIKKAFDAIEKTYPLYYKLSGRDRDIERAISLLQELLAKSEHRKEYELSAMLQQLEIKEIRESISGTWTAVQKQDWEPRLKMLFGREFKGSYEPYDMVWVFPAVKDVQKKTWIVIKGEWKK